MKELDRKKKGQVGIDENPRDKKQYNREDGIVILEAGDGGQSREEVLRPTNTLKNKSESETPTMSTSFFSSSISFSFFFPFAFFLPPCSEVAASSYCSRPSWKRSEGEGRKKKKGQIKNK